VVYTVKYYPLKKLTIILCLSSLTIEYKCQNFNKFYLGCQPNLAPVTAADHMLGNDAWKTTFLFVTALLNSAEFPWGLGGRPRGTCSALATMDQNIQWDMSVVRRHFEPRFVSVAALHCQMHNALSQTATCQRDISRSKMPISALPTRDNKKIYCVWCTIRFRRLELFHLFAEDEFGIEKCGWLSSFRWNFEGNFFLICGVFLRWHRRISLELLLIVYKTA
jgi:hypothetical protein